MKDVARLAGVSVATVSRVINQTAYVEPNTLRKVKDAIVKLNYTPNLLAKGLRQQNGQGAAGALYAAYDTYREAARQEKPYPGRPGRGKRLAFAGVARHTFSAAVEHGVSAQAVLAGCQENHLTRTNNQYEPDIALHNADQILAAVPDLFIEFQADARVNHIVAEKFEQAGIPIIAVDIPVPGAPFVGVNNWQAAKMGGDYMAELIKRKWRGWGAVELVVLLQNPEGGEVTMLRSEGFADALTEAFGAEVEEKLARVDGGPGSAEHAHRAMAQVLADHPQARNIAVTSINEESMAGVISALQQASRWHPEETIIVTLGVDDLGKTQLREGLTDAGVAFFPEKYGEYILPAACAMLDGTPVPSHIYVEHQIVTRQTIDRFYPA